MSKVQVHRHYSQKTFFCVFLKCTIVSDIYEHVQNPEQPIAYLMLPNEHLSGEASQRDVSLGHEQLTKRLTNVLIDFICKRLTDEGGNFQESSIFENDNY